jgi:hypothetical protein
MADLRVDQSALSDISARMRSAASALSWDLHTLDFDLLGAFDVADAAATVRALGTVRVQVVAEMTAAAAEYPDDVAAEFTELDTRLGRTVQ